MRKKVQEIRNCFSDQAFDSEKRNRKLPEDNSVIMWEIEKMFDPFTIDFQKILNSESFKKLSKKTQVFHLKENPLITNRMTHSLEVCSVAQSIATILGLNVELTKAVAIGHDLGHGPFGHLGENILSEISKEFYACDFRHEQFGVILANKIENQGRGLNLCQETLTGILKHSRGNGDIQPENGILLEYNVVMLADKIAYTFADLRDSLKLGRFTKDQLPLENIFEENYEQNINTCILALCLESAEEGCISFEKSKVAMAFKRLRNWMYENLYTVIDQEEIRQKNKKELISTFYFIEGYFGLGKFFYEQENLNLVHALAIMTDKEVSKINKIKDEGVTIANLEEISKMPFFKMTKYCQKNNY